MLQRFVFLFLFCGLFSPLFTPGDAWGAAAGNAQAAPTCLLPAPANLQKVFIQPTTVVYTWDAVPGAVKYYAALYDITAGGMVVTQQPTGTTITISGLILGHDYHFLVAPMCTEKDVSVFAAHDYFKAPNILIDLIVEIQSGCPSNLYGPSVGQGSGSLSTYTCANDWQTNRYYWMRFSTGGNDYTIRFEKNIQIPGRYFMTIVDPSGGNNYQLTCSLFPCSEVRLTCNDVPVMNIFFPNDDAISGTVLNGTSPVPFTVHEGCGGNEPLGSPWSDGASGETQLTSLTAAPNPFTDALTLYFPDAPEGIIKTRLLDLRSSVQLETNIEPGQLSSGVYSLQTESLPAGMYFLQMEMPSGQVVNLKVMKI